MEASIEAWVSYHKAAGAVYGHRGGGDPSVVDANYPQTKYWPEAPLGGGGGGLRGEVLERGPGGLPVPWGGGGGCGAPPNSWVCWPKCDPAVRTAPCHKRG